jgi:hypothetical protein
MDAKWRISTIWTPIGLQNSAFWVRLGFVFRTETRLRRSARPVWPLGYSHLPFRWLSASNSAQAIGAISRVVHGVTRLATSARKTNISIQIEILPTIFRSVTRPAIVFAWLIRSTSHCYAMALRDGMFRGGISGDKTIPRLFLTSITACS